MVLSNRQRIMAIVVLPMFLMVIAVIAATFYQTYRAASLEALEQTQILAEQYASLLNVNLREAALVANLAKVGIEQYIDLTPKKISVILRGNVLSNSFVFGSAVAFEPYQYDPKVKLYAPYAYRYHKEIREINIAEVAYDYTSGQWQWWEKPRATLQASWGDAYLGKSVGVLMVTYSAPLIKNEKFWGVVTVDVSLSQLHDLVQSKLKESMNFFIINREGQYVYHPDTSLVTSKASFTATQGGDDPTSLAVFNTITSGQSGVFQLAQWNGQRNVWLYYHPLDVADWYFVVVSPQEEVFHAVNTRFVDAGVIVLIGLFLIFLLMWVLTDIAARYLRSLDYRPVSLVRYVMSGMLPLIMIIALLGGLVYWVQNSEGAPYLLSQIVQAIPLGVWVVLLIAGLVCVWFYAAMQSAYSRLDDQTRFTQQLLLRSFPYELVNVMHQYEQLIPQLFSRAAVLTIEFIDMSSWVASSTAQQVFEVLSALYRRFDALVGEQTQFYAISEGHSYRIFTGVSQLDDEGVFQLAGIAIKLRDIIQQFNEHHGTSIAASLAMHAGDVIAGTLNTAHSQYAIVGSLLPVAQAIADLGDFGIIYVSQVVYETLKFDYDFVSRGTISLKHYGEYAIYQLTGMRPTRFE